MRRRGGADPYVPGHGDVTYSVEHYALDISYSPGRNHLAGRAEVTAVAQADLSSLTLDLHGLKATKVRLDGSPPAKFTHRASRLVIHSRAPITRGTEFRVQVAYEGTPKTVPGIDGDAGWEELTDGAIVASQPHGAPSWYPCNDRPSDKARYTITVTAPDEYTVVANGIPTGFRRRASSATWTYEQAEPMAPYLATVQIGSYQTKADGGSPEITVVQPRGTNGRVKAAFADQRAMLDFFERTFGPYPFASGYAVVVTPDELEIPLEAQGLSIFGINHLSTDWEAQRLIAHELSHQWFGNSLTAGAWRDIWLHEGFACYSEWLWSEESGGPTAAEHAAPHHELLAGLDQDLVLGDPGPEVMFDDRVYKRGALTLHALRSTIGDDAFFTLLRRWVEEHRHGTVTTEMLTELAGEVSGQDLGDLFRAWLWEEGLPDLP